MADVKYEFDPAQISKEEAQKLPAFDPGSDARHPAQKTAHVVVPRNDATAVATSPVPAEDAAATVTPARTHSMFARVSRIPIELFRRIGRVLFVCIDRVLAVANMPFARLTPATRNLVGIVSAGTMLIAAAAMIAKPILFPEPDPVGDLRRQVRAPVQSVQPVESTGVAH